MGGGTQKARGGPLNLRSFCGFYCSFYKQEIPPPALKISRHMLIYIIWGEAKCVNFLCWVTE